MSAQLHQTNRNARAMSSGEISVLCGSEEAAKARFGFLRYSDKNCCLPDGGLPSTPSPPSGKNCPPSGWYWSKDYSSCVPSHPLSASSPPPQCPKGWDWSPSTYSCQHQASPTSTSRPSPSASGHHQKKSTHGALSRNRKRAAPACPLGLDACPISGAHGITSDFECLDTFNELESCGGCASVGKGEDCTSIEGSWNVGCEQGTCAGKFANRMAIRVPVLNEA